MVEKRMIMIKRGEYLNKCLNKKLNLKMIEQVLKKRG